MLFRPPTRVDATSLATFHDFDARHLPGCRRQRAPEGDIFDGLGASG
jgi:hypothetical protein